MKLIDLRANSELKMKFDYIYSLSNAPETNNFWRSLPCEHFPELQKYVQGYACRLGITYRCEHAISSMKSIKNKLRWQVSDSNVKNGVMLSITNLAPNITDLLKAKQYQKCH